MSTQKSGPLTIISYRSGEHQESVINVYQSAMSTEPWFETLHRDTVVARIDADFAQPFSEQYVAEIDGVVCAAMWWDKIDFDLLRIQRGKELAEYWQSHTSGAKTVWFRDLLVMKEWQAKGIGREMVDFAIEAWQVKSYMYAMLRIHLGGYADKSIPPNIKARRLYERKGFVLVPDVTKIARDINHNEIRMGYMMKRIGS